ncbi:efflux RND transporter periplasmic adaptor subunit [Acidobacteriota bacterium]
MRKILPGTMLAFTFLLFLLSCRNSNQKEAPGEDNSIAAPVKVIAVKRDTISEKLHQTGLIQAWREIKITPSIGGQIDKIYVAEGERVKQGQLLAELDTRAVRLQRDQAEAGVAVAEANYRDANRNMERMERLRQERAVSEQQYEKVKLVYEAAEAQLQQAQAVLNLAKYNVDVSLMKAPFTGVVASMNAKVGDVINPMMAGFIPNSGVLTLMDYSRTKIEANFSERDILRIRKGQLVQVEVAAYPGEVFHGLVSMVNHTANPQSKKFAVEVVFDNPGLRLKPNSFGEITFIVEKHEDVLVIPLKAVLENKYVITAKGETAKKTAVTLGLQSRDMVEVLDGLEEGDLIVAEGNFGLEEGMTLDILEVLK